MISKDQLISEYTMITNDILDECDWKTHFDSEEVCRIAYNILIRNYITPKFSFYEFYALYLEKIDGIWTKDFTSIDCLDIIYDILS